MILSKVNFHSGQRLDVQDLTTIELFGAKDLQILSKFITNDPTIVHGCDLTALEGLVATFDLSNSYLFFPLDDVSCFYHANGDFKQNIELEEGLQFIEIIPTRENTTIITKTFIDQTAGEMFDSDVPVENTIKININKSLVGFTTGSLPICKINVENGTVKTITDCRNMLFSLWNGGSNPSRNNFFKVSPEFKQPPLSCNGSDIGKESSAFVKADLNNLSKNESNFHSLKEWMNAIMTTLQSIKGEHWLNNTSESLSLQNINFNYNSTLLVPSKNKVVSWSKNPISKMADNHFRINGELIFESLHSNLTWKVSPIDVNVLEGQNIYIGFERENLRGVCYFSNISKASGLVDYSKTAVAINDGEFEGIKIGDYLRLSSKTIYDYVKIVAYVYDGLVINDLNAEIPYSCKEVLLSQSLGSTSEEFLWMRSKYSSTDVYVGNESYFRSPNFYHIGKRIGDEFFFKGYGMLSVGEEVTLGNESVDTPTRSLSLIYPSQDLRFKQVGGKYRLYSESGSRLLKIQKQFKRNDVLNNSLENFDSKIFNIHDYIEFDYQNDKVWVNYSSNYSSDINLIEGSCFVTNQFEVRRNFMSPVTEVSTENVDFLLQYVTFNGKHYALFFDGTLIGENGITFTNDVYFEKNITVNGNITAQNVILSGVVTLNGKDVSNNYTQQNNDNILYMTTLGIINLKESVNGHVIKIIDKNNLCDWNQKIEAKILDKTFTLEDKGGSLELSYFNNTWNLT